LSISEQTEAQRLAIEAIEGVQQDIADIENPGNANAIIELIPKDIGKAQTNALKSMLLKKCTELRFVFNRETGQFEVPKDLSHSKASKGPEPQPASEPQPGIEDLDDPNGYPRTSANESALL
jgi:hypothetical protein